MQSRHKGIFIVSFVMLALVSECVNVVMKDATQEPTADLQATAKALLAHPVQAQDQAPAATATIVPVPTATRYVPEGELAYFNFTNLAEGWEDERGEGVTLRNPGTFGIEISLTRDSNYYLATGVQDHPDGNISTYVLNVTPPQETTAFVACRVQQTANDDEDFDQAVQNAYRAQLRLDGAARLIKEIDESEYVLKDWVSGVAINPEGVYNQLYLLCDGPRLLFMVNGQVVFDIQDNSLTKGDFAIGVVKNPSGAETVVRFDKVAVFEP